MTAPAQGISGSVIAVVCPSCGAPTPASLLSAEQLRCRSCGYAGPPSAEAKNRLGALGYLLSQFDVRERQLSSAQRRALVSVRLFRGTAVFLAVNVFLPLACAGFYYTAVPFPTGGDIALAVGGGLPIMLMAAGGLASVWLLLRRRQKLLDACAALPPLDEGEPARCHVCGGPVAPAPGSPIARCGYCNADNVVSPEAFERSRASRSAAADAIEAEVRRQASATSQTTVGWAVVLSLLVLFMSPLLLIGSCGLAVMGVARAELPVDDTQEYALWAESGRRCYGLVERKGGGAAELTFGEPQPPGFPRKKAVPAGTPLSSVRASALQGAMVRLGGLDVGPVATVYLRAFQRDNALRVQGPRGWEVVPVAGACVPGADEAVAVRPLLAFGGPMVHDAAAAYAADNSNTRAAVVRIPVSGTPVADLASAGSPILDLQLAGDDVYYALFNAIYVVPKAGGVVTKVASVQGLPEFAVDDQYLYTNEFDAGANTYSIRRTPRRGGAATSIAAHKDMPCELAQHGNRVYWFTCTQAKAFTGGALMSVAKSGGAAEVLAPDVLRPAEQTNAQFDDTRMYWATRAISKYTIVSMPLEGGELTTVAEPTSMSGLTADSSFLYWGQYSTILRVAKTGGEIEKLGLPAGSGACNSLAVFPGAILYLDDSAKRIIRWPR